MTRPEVTWAQRSSSSDAERNYLYVNIKAPDVDRKEATLKITPTNVTFAGDSKKGVRYEISLDLYAEIDPENSKVNHSDREVELILRKKELKEEYWPRLLKATEKQHYLKTDFDKWVDEDEQDEAAEDDYANNFGGFEGLGGGEGGLGNIDFSKLGAGLEGMGGAAGDAPGAEGESDDEEMPELEEAGEPAKSSKVQEVS
ncbi:Prostaglandin E synthase 3 (Cytosolic) [Aspergillus alliaceus]|uniref:HSP20-like chaperone n=1 Tax=Petromyces alliaceus TaxID=209559 RepID=A0A5N6FYZ8_PETAA|nr:HSP20-like chaperone [Aspergillus alliaceus]KAB8234455.1 HSP20-like chaperone [Aspergillus alliaceus]KAE8387810.1 HSP20-like chaperone [Aspergillus alliaceus]KAF5858754.1 Prostaglandin E synthase 3 (Cytosolic) [Aspergillus burnettii]